MCNNFFAYIEFDFLTKMYQRNVQNLCLVKTFQTMFNNGLLKKGDKVALITPIFTPYLEIPELSEYELEIVELRLDETTWQLPMSEIEKLADTDIKLLCVVNPANPASVKFSDETLDNLSNFVNNERSDLFIVTDIRHIRGRLCLTVRETAIQHALCLLVLEVLRCNRLAFRLDCDSTQQRV